LAAEEGYASAGNGWWESAEGLRFLERRLRDPCFDRLVDGKLLEVAGEGGVLLDSWTMPWLVKGGFKIWLSASVGQQAERIARRDKMSVQEALVALREKEARTKAIYKGLYGFVLGEDFSPFDFVLDTDNLSADEVFRVLCLVVDNVVFGCKKPAE
jgi:cytidylate kinase